MLLEVTITHGDKVAIAVIGGAFLLLLTLVVVIDQRVKEKTPFDQFHLPYPQMDSQIWVVPKVYDLKRFMELVFSYVQEDECLVVQGFVGSIDIERYRWFEGSIYDESLALMLSAESKKLILQYLSEVVVPSSTDEVPLDFGGKTYQTRFDDSVTPDCGYMPGGGIQISDGTKCMLLGDSWSGGFCLSQRVPSTAIEQASRDGVLVYFSSIEEVAT